MAEPTSPRITAVIVNYRTAALALRCLEALSGERAAMPQLDAIVVDGGSGDGSAETLAAALAEPRFAGWTTLLPLPLNGGFGYANNQAMLHALQRATPPDHLYLVNPDAAVEPGALAALAAALAQAGDAAAAGSLLLTPAGQPLGSAFRFLSATSEFFRAANLPALQRRVQPRPMVIEADRETDADWVTGASVLLRAEALRACGLFDDGFFLYFEEVELMHRFRAAGWRVLHVPESRVRHVGGAATGVVDGSAVQPRLPDYWFRSRRRYFARAYGPAWARVSALAWIAGYGLWRLRELAGLGRHSRNASGELGDLWRNGLGATAADRRGAVARWDDPPGRPPAWMQAA